MCVYIYIYICDGIGTYTQIVPFSVSVLAAVANKAEAAISINHVSIPISIHYLLFKKNTTTKNTTQ